MNRRLVIATFALTGLAIGAAQSNAQGTGGRGGRRGGPPPGVQGRGENTQPKAFEWSGEVASGQRLTLRSESGRVLVEPATGKTLEIVANKRWRRGRPEAVKVEATRVNSGVLLCARWVANAECDETHYSVEHRGDDPNDTAVDFVIKLPAGVNLVLSIVNGDITVTGASGEIRALTTNGRVRLETTETVTRAEAMNGSVHVQMAKLPPRGARYSSINGSVTVTLPDGVDANIDASTAFGSISLDFPFALNGPFSPKRMRGTIGKGGPVLELVSVTGSIRVEKK